MRTLLVSYSRGRDPDWFRVFARRCAAEGHECIYASGDEPERNGEIQFPGLTIPMGWSDAPLDDLATQWPDVCLDAFTQTSQQLTASLEDIVREAGVDTIVTEGVVALSLVGRLNEECRLPGVFVPWLHVVTCDYKYGLRVSERQRAIALRLLQSYIRQPDVLISTTRDIAHRTKKDYATRRVPAIIPLDALALRPHSADAESKFLRFLRNRPTANRLPRALGAAPSSAFSLLHAEMAVDDPHRRMRVWHGPALPSEHIRLLSDALERQGIRSRCMTIGAHELNLPVDKHLQSKNARSETRALVEISRRFDIAHFSGRGLYMKANCRLPEMLDMLALRAAGVAVIMSLDGRADARSDQINIEYLNALASGITVPDPTYRDIVPDAEVISHAINFTGNNSFSKIEGRVPRILCLEENSSQCDQVVLTAIEALRLRGYSVEFVSASGLAPQSVTAEIQAADIIIDQSGAGWYSDLAAKCMGYGKVVVVHIRADHLDAFAPDGPPFPTAGSNDLEHVLQTLLESESVRHGWAERSRAYARKTHDPDSVAAAYVAYFTRVLQKQKPIDVPKVIGLIERQASVQAQLVRGVSEAISGAAAALRTLQP